MFNFLFYTKTTLFINIVRNSLSHGCVDKFSYFSKLRYSLPTGLVLFSTPKRTNSFFSYFRRNNKKKNPTKSTEQKIVDNDSTWIDAVRRVEESGLSLSGKSTDAMTKFELRKWKKRAFLHVLEMFLHRSGKNRHGFNTFVLNALSQMSEYEVEDDLECYKAIINLFPTGRMVVTRFLQAEWGHFQRQQETMVKLLQQMARNHVMPDDEVGQMIINVFGWRNHAMQHYRHMMYWVPKLYYSNPWPMPVRIRDSLDQNPEKLAILIAERICPDLMTEFNLVQLSESDRVPDHPYALISAQSPEQRALFSYCTKTTHQVSNPNPIIYLDGPHYVWFRTLQAAYYTLWTEIDSKRLQREIEMVKQSQNQFVYGKNDPWKLSFFGPGVDNSDRILEDCTQKKSDLLLSNFTESKNRLSTFVHHSHQISETNPIKIMKAEEEFDNRWLALRQGHEYKFLPSSLVQHEQSDGTILALAVVVPSKDALENQAKLYSWEVANVISGSESDKSNLKMSPKSESHVAQVPSPASPTLIRYWVRELQEKNPCFDKATLIIRVPADLKPEPVSSEIKNSNLQDEKHASFRSAV